MSSPMACHVPSGGLLCNKLFRRDELRDFLVLPVFRPLDEPRGRVAVGACESCATSPAPSAFDGIGDNVGKASGLSSAEGDSTDMLIKYWPQPKRDGINNVQSRSAFMAIFCSQCLALFRRVGLLNKVAFGCMWQVWHAPKLPCPYFPSENQGSTAQLRYAFPGTRSI